MNTDILQGKWMQLRGQAKQRWGNLTDSDLDRVNGKSEELAGLLREKYGYTTEKAHQEIDSFLKEHGRPEQPATPTAPAKPVAAAMPITPAKPVVDPTMVANTDILQGKWMQLRGQAKQRWGNLTDSDLDRANGKTEELAGLLREKYGYTTEKAHQEIDSFLKEHNK